MWLIRIKRAVNIGRDIEFHRRRHQMPIMAPLLILSLFIFLLAYLANHLARRKGRGTWVWTVATALLLFPVLILLLLPPVSPDTPSPT